MTSFFKKSTYWLLVFTCLILWNVVLVSCGDDEGGDDGELLSRTTNQSLALENIDWLTPNKVRLQWKAIPSAKSYLIYDTTEDGPSIRGAVDSTPDQEWVEITIDDIEFSQRHRFQILAN